MKKGCVEQVVDYPGVWRFELQSLVDPKNMV